VWLFAFDAGARRMSVYREGYRMEPAEIAVEIEEGKTVSKECRLVLLGTVMVTVLDPSGAPVTTGVRFRRRTADGKTPAAYGRHMGDGIYHIRLDPGETTILVSTKAAAAEPIAVEVKAGKTVAVTASLVETGE
jgi:hypothetical protein